MGQPTVLLNAQKHLQTVVFDPKNHLHLEAMDLLIHHGRQHPTVRFVVEHPYQNVRSMMLHKVAAEFLSQHQLYPNKLAHAALE